MPGFFVEATEELEAVRQSIPVINHSNRLCDVYFLKFFRPFSNELIISPVTVLNIKMKPRTNTVLETEKPAISDNWLLGELVGIRTPNLLIRSQVLYPIELQVRQMMAALHFEVANVKKLSAF
jgi:hypothetical protein